MKATEELPLERLKTEAERWIAAVGGVMPITAEAAKELRSIVQRAHDLGCARGTAAPSGEVKSTEGTGGRAFDEWIARELPRATGYEIDMARFVWESAIASTRVDAATIIERKAKALTDEYCRGDSGPGGYVWINKEAEWQVILLEELAEEIRNAKRI